MLFLVNPQLKFNILFLKILKLTFLCIVMRRKTIFVPLLLETISELHKTNMMHGDLKPQNIFIKANGAGCYQMKLCDFDCCRLINILQSQEI